ncbi:intermembrane phospholipid transport protein YdbH family protein [Oceanisphaera sp. W20_SRM_FM3]|uniref:intermembrane phospholipid transport protein YdbH family protein n=1 Tax=Oceanisphaera sp. W20_SRM_FM3 TaxID=3240267 RepID=UPI003F970C74
MIQSIGVALALLLLLNSSVHASAWSEDVVFQNALSQVEISVDLHAASVTACPKEQASKLSLSLINGQVQGHLAQLSLDLTCSQSRLTTRLNSNAEPANKDALSLLLTLPAIDFTIDTLTLQLPEGRFSGPAELHHKEQQLNVVWQSSAGNTKLAITPDRQGWRWQGELPGALFTPSLRQPFGISGGWQPEQPVTLNVNGALPTPLVGNWQLALMAEQVGDGWQLLPRSRLSVPSLKWKDLVLNQLTLTPERALALDKPWQASVSWQPGVWKKQPVPAASLQLEGASLDNLQGQVRAELAPDLQLTGHWRYHQGLALTVPAQSVSAASTWSWLTTWLRLPVALNTEAGQLQVSLSAANLLNNKQPILVHAHLTDGQLKYGDIQLEQLAAKLKLSWNGQQGWRSLGPQAMSAAKLALGVPVTNVQGAWRWQAEGIELQGLTAHLLGGQLALSPMALTRTPTGEAHFSDISLEKLLNYASVTGLTGSGLLKGRLPFVYDQGLSIKNGRAESHDGWISYQASPQLIATGEANISLGLTLGLLSDLRYDRLSANISMAKTGEANITSQLIGRAPVKGKLHAVNFNYNHQENLLQLLASLRFAKDLTERLPANLQGESE